MKLSRNIELVDVRLVKEFILESYATAYARYSKEKAAIAAGRTLKTPKNVEEQIKHIEVFVEDFRSDSKALAVAASNIENVRAEPVCFMLNLIYDQHDGVAMTYNGGDLPYRTVKHKVGATVGLYPSGHARLFIHGHAIVGNNHKYTVFELNHNAITYDKSPRVHVEEFTMNFKNITDFHNGYFVDMRYTIREIFDIIADNYLRNFVNYLAHTRVGDKNGNLGNYYLQTHNVPFGVQAHLISITHVASSLDSIYNLLQSSGDTAPGSEEDGCGCCDYCGRTERTQQDATDGITHQDGAKANKDISKS